MRRAAIVLILAIFGACGTGDSQRPAPPAPSIAEVTANSSVPPTTTPVASTTTTTQPEADDGTESIGVTDEVTIVITDPEGG